MWDCMLGTSNMEPEERANALTAAATSLVTSCSAIKPDVVTKAVYAAGTGAVQVQVTDCERTSQKNLTSYESYKAGRERKINRLGLKRLWGRFFEFKVQPKTRDEWTHFVIMEGLSWGKLQRWKNFVKDASIPSVKEVHM
mmetsp:Transcript_30826/g.60705  ORF Transcript_30826/g.60705 Transcript_30826/m.60705 type:complete len:140 (+) Transcript_30826:364-783(+)